MFVCFTDFVVPQFNNTPRYMKDAFAAVKTFERVSKVFLLSPASEPFRIGGIDVDWLLLVP